MTELLSVTGGVKPEPLGDPNLPGVCSSPTLDRGMFISLMNSKITERSEVAGGMFNGVGIGADEEQEEGEQLQRFERRYEMNIFARRSVRETRTKFGPKM